MELNLVQGSESWLEYRRSKIGASDCGAILGLNPHRSLNQVWLSKQEGYVNKDNPAMKQGRNRESEALRLFESETGQLMSPKVFESNEITFLMASLDGYDAMDEKIGVEIKCPYYDKSHLEAINGEIPKYYIAQMQHQMYVAELDEIYYCSYRPEYLVNPLYIEIIKRDDDFIANMIEKETDFYFDHMLPKRPPSNDNQIKMIDSDIWTNLSNEYLRLDRQEKEAVKRKEEIKDLLLQVCNMENAKGNGIILTKVERKGIINYQNIPILKTMDLEEFRKPSTTSWRIAEVNNDLV